MRSLSFRRHITRYVPLLLCCVVFSSAAQAIVQGTPSTLIMHMVRVAGPGGALMCSGTVIDPLHVVTAAHCGPSAVVDRGKWFGVVKRAQAAKLKDGRTISVTGDALILTLRHPLPSTVIPIDIGIQGTDGEFVIAGFGAIREANRGWLGPLHQATVVVHEPFRLVAPDRMSDITASACFGDSGGAVLRNGALVGVITRASHPHPVIACGHLTHYAPVVATPLVEMHPQDGFEVSAAPRNPQRRLMYRRAPMPR